MEQTNSPSSDLAELISELGLPWREGNRLVAAVLGCEPSRVGANPELNPSQIKSIRQQAERRRSGFPLQYLEGELPFGPINLQIDPRVLVPRPETEYMWEIATRIASSPARIADLGTGSGALTLALADRFPDAEVIGTDLSLAALGLAHKNARKLGLEVEFRSGSLYDPLPADWEESVDLLVSNPPYLSEAEWDQAPIEVRHEPRQALVAGPEGTELIEEIIAGLPRWLSPTGQALIEIGETQGALVEEWANQNFLQGKVVPDLSSRDRYLHVTRT